MKVQERSPSVAHIPKPYNIFLNPHPVSLPAVAASVCLEAALRGRDGERRARPDARPPSPRGRDRDPRPRPCVGRRPRPRLHESRPPSSPRVPSAATGSRPCRLRRLRFAPILPSTSARPRVHGNPDSSSSSDLDDLGSSEAPTGHTLHCSMSASSDPSSSG